MWVCFSPGTGWIFVLIPSPLLLFFFLFSKKLFSFLSPSYHSASGLIMEVCLLATLTHINLHTPTVLHIAATKGRQTNRDHQPFEDTFCLMLFIKSFWVWHCLITKTFVLHKWREERKRIGKRRSGKGIKEGRGWGEEKGDRTGDE